jgi:hypothetical protein
VALFGVLEMIGGGVAGPALATCPLNADTGIWISSGAYQHGHGVRLVSNVQVENQGDCNTGPTAEGTAYEAIGSFPEGDWAEIGWIQYTSPGGAAFYLFTEWGVATHVTAPGGVAQVYNSGCATANNDVTFRVVYTGSGKAWKMEYACNGGGFTNRDQGNSLEYTTGLPAGEISHHSTINATYYSTESSLQRKSDQNVWSSGWGGLICPIWSAPHTWNAHNNGSSTGYTTNIYSSGECPT